MAHKPLIVVALGGNAITQEGEIGTVEEQFTNSRVTARQLADLVEQGNQLVVTHGNGPQIGNFMLRNEAAADQIHPLSMEVAAAHVGGGMGFMIAQTLTNELHDRGMDINVATIITTVLVDRDDDAFANPTKPIGRTMTKDQADNTRHRDWVIKEITPGKFRRVVPSPVPTRIMELDTIKRSVQAGDILVACGGGGVPVLRKEDGHLTGIAAVIDKDLASALLASELDADGLIILTNVDRVCTNFGKPDQQSLDQLTIDQAKACAEQGHFAVGSMGPKVRGAVQFLEGTSRPDAFAVIGPLDKAADAVAGSVGTRFTKT